MIHSSPDELGCQSVFQHLAAVCERLNDFARVLRNDSRLVEVTTSTDIRYYETGWKIEKYVEALLDTENGYAAVWSFELSEEKGAWRIDTNTSVSYGDYDEEVETRHPNSLTELNSEMTDATTNLIATNETGRPFRAAIESVLPDRG